jgi:hypothetical protein
LDNKKVTGGNCPRRASEDGGVEVVDVPRDGAEALADTDRHVVTKTLLLSRSDAGVEAGFLSGFAKGTLVSTSVAPRTVCHHWQCFMSRSG